MEIAETQTGDTEKAYAEKPVVSDSHSRISKGVIFTMNYLTPTIKTNPPNLEFTRLAPVEQITKTVQALEANGIATTLVETAEQARQAALALIPPGAEVYNAASRTLEQIGLTTDILSSGGFRPLRARLGSLDRIKQEHEYHSLIAGAEVIVGSIHAITSQGQILLASATGSQMAAAVFGAAKVIWVAGTQKLVPSLEEGLRRIREYSYLLENERTLQVYGKPSAINKILIVNGETPGRITIVLVKQNLGF